MIFNDKDFQRKCYICEDVLRMSTINVSARQENAYTKALLNNEEISEKLSQVKIGLKERRKNAFLFEKAQYESMLRDEPVKFADFFMEIIVNKMIDTHCGFYTAARSEIQCIDYILQNFDDYYNEYEFYIIEHSENDNN